MEPRAGTKKRSRALIVLALVALGIYALDQYSKYLVVASMTEGSVIRVLNDVLQLHFVRNPGAAFSLASGSTWIFSIIAAAVVVFIIWFARRIRSLAWGLVFGLLLGGVLGNLTDRLLREPGFGVGHVVDFISTPWLLPAIYNVADMAIVTSMIIFMILTIRGIGLDGNKVVAVSKTATATVPVATAMPLETPPLITDAVTPETRTSEIVTPDSTARDRQVPGAEALP
ncbi:signal peptidase II [Cryobacterium sp. TMT1-3]|uniref:Lipoprotein signal peptidase n=1 Tax=Cryobacterium luteum TaxID=1424661 RepID=A0A1H8GQS8_9MICO|nr:MULTISPECIES: signal peptidase II [Cryobacterium]TFB84627.1 signal peptidase II [Cryobacterium luteum]TFC28423.1 signal peptidase II [Cryobacterium sp. TMT1-3]SEN46190.1 signal peptidase II [Cryobacterium luteum]